ncbi:hypothetical protein JK635_07775 [Neobacillus sp. YIM B02564]|uniref:Uncharacterized protein n=1 Tax=Neobacillus paridis TaxID=2803862 RepID=A0ABS1TNG6_9BACI|nr:hypothetical protein [Neobacillus paridis]MBL4952108.1 hypothetical protein [Neobacillus paridis]
MLVYVGSFFPKEFVLIGLLFSLFIKFLPVGHVLVGLGLASIIGPIFTLTPSLEIAMMVICITSGFVISPKLSNEYPLLYIIFLLIGLSMIWLNWDYLLSIFANFLPVP